ncbi:MAG: hypothetical protein EA399_17035 [Desulfovibrionales bacterium]|nr:MAG: hypothetical protein EA399_17035 [Desulfovibrionales bacterium]
MADCARPPRAADTLWPDPFFHRAGPTAPDDPPAGRIPFHPCDSRHEPSPCSPPLPFCFLSRFKNRGRLISGLGFPPVSHHSLKAVLWPCCRHPSPPPLV